MEGKCYYCGKDLTERNIKKHMKNCKVMQKYIDEKFEDCEDNREQFIISIKPKYGDDKFCIYVSIDGGLTLRHLDRFIRDVWLECCEHLSMFIIDRYEFDDENMDALICDALDFGDKIEYQYDFGNTTYLNLEVVDLIEVPEGFSQIEIIARNNEKKDKTKNCDYCNTPRDGVCGYEGDRDAEKKYMVKNTLIYERSSYGDNEYDSEEVDFMEEELEELFREAISEFEKNLYEIFANGLYSFDIRELLKDMSKKPIYEILENLGAKKTSKLKKPQLINKLIEQYESLIENKINLFGEDRVEYLKNIIKNDGVSYVEKDDFEYAIYFLRKGMLFPSMKDGREVVIMPRILQEYLKAKNELSYKRKVKLNNEIISIYRGMNQAYGILEIKDAIQLLRRYIIHDIEDDEILEILKERREYYYEYDIVDEKYLANNLIENSKYLRDVISGEDTEYAFIKKEELISMGKENWISQTKGGKEFIKEFINTFDIEIEDIERTMEIIRMGVQEDDPSVIVDSILENTEDISTDGINDIISILNRFMWNIRLWKYKGHTIKERNTIALTKFRAGEIRRNDTCPCGSEKKYKKCCGRNN